MIYPTDPYEESQTWETESEKIKKKKKIVKNEIHKGRAR